MHGLRGGSIALVLALPVAVFAQADRCAASFAEASALLGQLQLARRWRETTMGDGKPLVVHLSGEESALRLSFEKSGEGLWAEGPVRICRRAARVEAEIARAELVVGPAAGWAMKPLFAAGATFRLELLRDGKLRIAVPGWSGDFERAD